MLDKSLLVLTEKELRDALRNRWFLAYALAFLLLSSTLSLLVYLTGAVSPVSGFGRTAASLVNLMLLLVPLMGLTLGALALAGDRERGALDFWLSQPVSTGTFFLAKVFGLGTALAAAVLLSYAVGGVLLFWVGATDVEAFVILAMLTMLLAWASLGLGFLVSSRSARTSTAFSVALGVWLLLVFLGNLGLLGTTLAVRLSPGWLLALAVLNPVETYRIAALRTLAGTLELLGPAGLYADERLGLTLIPLLVSGLVMWTAVSTLLSFLVLRREVLR